MVYDCCTTLPPSRLLDLITFCPGRTEATVHWSSGAEPVLLTMTLKPWACSEFTVSCTDCPPDGSARVGAANANVAAAIPVAARVVMASFIM